LLRGTPPFQCKELIAEKIMYKEKLNVLHEVASMTEVKECLESGHHGFPVINDLNKVVGMINKNFLIILIENSKFYDMKATSGQNSINNRKSAKPGEKLNFKEHDLSDEEFEQSKSNSGMRTSLIRDRSQSAAAFSVQVGTVHKPISDDILDWTKFCTDINSTNRAYEEVQEIVEESINLSLDVRPYMVHHPYLAFTHDSFAKVLDIFRLMHLRHLPVISGNDGELRGMITR
jgi:CBS domain-containing protein